MRKLIYILILLPSLVLAQETVLTHEMGDEAARGKINQNFDTAYTNVDSLKDVVDPADSTAVLTVLTSDSVSMGAVYYSDTYWDDLRVPLTNTRINPVNTEPDFEDRGDGLFAWGFDADSDSAYVLNYTAQGAHTRADSTDEEGHFHWCPDGTNTGSVLWRLVYSMANVGGEWTTIDTLWALDPADGTALKYQLIDFGTLLGSDTMRISHGIIGHVSRIGEDARDTYTGTAYGIELDFHYQIDSPGSREEYIK